MSAVMDIVVRATDEASDVLAGVKDKAAGMGGAIQDNMGKITAATAGAGAGLEGLARSQQDNTEAARRLAGGTEMAEDEVRALAAEMSDATLPADEALGLMEAGRQQGIDSAEGLQHYTEAWDTVGDATGISAAQLADAAPALQAVGVSADDPTEAFDAFGYITQETSQDVDDLLQFVDRMGPELQDAGADVDDVAGIMGALEHEMGMTSRTARSELRTAINDADGDMDAALDTLGVSADMMEEYGGKVADSSDVVQDNADIHADSRTPLQELQAHVEGLMQRYGGLAEAGSMLAPVMIAIGPAMQGVTVATRALSGAMAFLAANPIVLVIAAVAALAAGIAYAWRNSETFRDVVTAVWDAVSGAVQWAWEGLIQPAFGALGAGLEALQSAGETLRSGWEQVWDGIRAVVRGTVNAIIGFMNRVPNGIEVAVNAVARGINSLPSFTVPDWVPGIGGEEFGLPEVPTIGVPRIPTLHTGGRFRTANPGGEGLALLKDREDVVEPGGVDALRAVLEDIRALLADGMVLEVDQGVLARSTRDAQRTYSDRNRRLGVV